MHDLDIGFDVDAEGDAATCRSATTVPTPPTTINATKALMAFRAIKFIALMIGPSLSQPFR
jgi:hypothetical protein